MKIDVERAFLFIIPYRLPLMCNKTNNFTHEGNNNKSHLQQKIQKKMNETKEKKKFNDLFK